MRGPLVALLERLRPDAGLIKKQYPSDSFPGHSAWLDNNWKLHRIEKKDGTTRLELYNLEEDPFEKHPIDDPERSAAMKDSLEKWLGSVVHSLNGGDYASEE